MILNKDFPSELTYFLKHYLRHMNLSIFDTNTSGVHLSVAFILHTACQNTCDAIEIDGEAGECLHCMSGMGVTSRITVAQGNGFHI